MLICLALENIGGGGPDAEEEGEEGKVSGQGRGGGRGGIFLPMTYCSNHRRRRALPPSSAVRGKERR